MRKRWRLNEFHLTLEKLNQSGQFKLTVWAASQQARLRLHEHEERLHHLHSLSGLGLHSEHRDQLQRDLLGVGGIQRLQWESEFPMEPKKYSELTDQERDRIKKSRLLCKIRAKIENSTELDSFFAPCTWICTQCGNVNIAGNLACVNFTTIEG